MGWGGRVVIDVARDRVSSKDETWAWVGGSYLDMGWGNRNRRKALRLGLTRHTHAHTSTHTYMYICVCVCVCVYIYIYIYIYIEREREKENEKDSEYSILILGRGACADDGTRGERRFSPWSRQRWEIGVFEEPASVSAPAA